MFLATWWYILGSTTVICWVGIQGQNFPMGFLSGFFLDDQWWFFTVGVITPEQQATCSVTPAHLRLLEDFGFDASEYCIKAEAALLGVHKLTVLETQEKTPVLELYSTTYLGGTYIPRCVKEAPGYIKVGETTLPGILLTPGYVQVGGEWYAIAGTQRKSVSALTFEPTVDEEARCSSGFCWDS